MMTPAHWSSLLLGPLLMVLSSHATALATIEGQVVNATCGISGASGTTFFECAGATPFGNGTGFQATIPNGSTAFVTATLRYAYRDDGLPLVGPTSIQLDTFGFQFLPIDHEAGAIYRYNRLCSGRGCPEPPGIEFGGIGFGPPLILGNDSIPDELSGELSLQTFLTVTPSYPSPTYSTFVFVDWLGVTFSGVAPVPEPATWMVLAAGMLVLAARMERRGKRCRNAGILPTRRRWRSQREA